MVEGKKDMKKIKLELSYEKLEPVILKVSKNIELSEPEKDLLRRACIYSICENHTGKMQDLKSISTSCKDNAQCALNAAIPGSICENCFSMDMHEMYGDNFYNKLHFNTLLYSVAVLPVDVLPELRNIQYFRLESFGDLNNSIQAANYFNIAKKNIKNHVRFALWSKNPRFIDQAIKAGYKKPSNINIIYSSLFLNNGGTGIMKKYSFIDRVFTVYTLEYLKAHPEIKINCGARDCFSCARCYKKSCDPVVNELLKSDQKKAIKEGYKIN